MSVDIQRKMRDDWDRRARVDPRYWVAATAEADEASYEESAVRDTQALVDGLHGRIAPSARVLDLGCGIGRLSAPLADRFAEVVGVDVSPAMIETARALHGDKPGVRFEATSGSDLAPFADATFDLVFSYSCLPHIPQDVVEGYFLEVGRVLRRGGWFRCQFWIGPAQDAATDDTLTIRVYERAWVDRVCADAGLTIRELETIDYLDPVLKLHPVWINAEKTAEPARRAAPPPPREADRGADERELEYGLLLYLAVKHDERGDVESAERVLEQCIAVDPKRPEAYVQWSRHRLDADDLAGGLTLLRALTEEVPDCAPGWLYRAQFAEASGQKAEATLALDKLAALRAPDAALRKEAQALRRRLRG